MFDSLLRALGRRLTQHCGDKGCRYVMPQNAFFVMLLNPWRFLCAFVCVCMILCHFPSFPLFLFICVLPYLCTVRIYPSSSVSGRGQRQITGKGCLALECRSVGKGGWPPGARWPVNIYQDHACIPHWWGTGGCGQGTEMIKNMVDGEKAWLDYNIWREKDVNMHDD